MSEVVAEATVEATTTTEAAKVVETVVPAAEVVKAEPVVEKVVEAPQEIKYDLKLSEGSLLDKARIDEVLAEAKSGKLTNEQAQSLLQREEKAVSGYQQTQLAQVETNRTEWLKALENDKEVGGVKFKENAETAHLFLKKHAPPEVMDFLEKSALGNNPSTFKFILKLANMAKSDKIITGGNATHDSNSDQDKLNRFYNNTKL